jgi:hypothetical protein
MDRSNPELTILPFQARLPDSPNFLTLDQALLAWRQSRPLSIERSYPGAPLAIGWTLFHRTPKKFDYRGDPLFRFEGGARRYLRQVYAIQHSLIDNDSLTYSYLHL